MIVKQDFEAANPDQARKVGEAIAVKIFREQAGFDYVELAKVELKEISTPS